VFSRCLFCHKPFPSNGSFLHLPAGRKIAYDPGRGRLWIICDRCQRWNLYPLEDRAEALWALERLARDRGRLLARTENVSLLEAGRLVLIRVGEAGLAEQAWWRYGRELRKRRTSYESRFSRVMSYAYGGVAYLGESLGLADVGLNVTWDDTPLADIVRWRRFGWAAWRGRVRCPYCDSVLRALLYDLSWWIYPLTSEDGKLAVGIPCARCDPWTPEKVYRLEGTEAVSVLRRALAYQHVAGASERVIRDAAREIESAGSPDEYAREVGEERASLWKLGTTRTVALEIAVNEGAERDMLQLEVRVLEQMWEKEEELARIMDEDLTPPGPLSRHLRRLPPRPAAKTPRVSS
jgi:hypothetical protein